MIRHVRRGPCTSSCFRAGNVGEQARAPTSRAGGVSTAGSARSMWKTLPVPVTGASKRRQNLVNQGRPRALRNQKPPMSGLPQLQVRLRWTGGLEAPSSLQLSCSSQRR